MMKNLAFILISLFMLKVSFSQIPNNSSRIIGIDFQSTDSTRFISFDYTTNQYDTLFTLDSVIISGANYTSYDPYRRLLYFPKTILDTLSLFKSSFYCLNMATQQIDSLFSIIDSGTIIDYHYNPFDNELLVLMQKFLLNYDIINHTLDTVCSVPYINAIFSSNPRYYNYIQQTMMFMDISSTQPYYKFVRIDIPNGKIDTIFEQTTQNAPGSTCYNQNDNYFYGLLWESQNNQKIVKINTITNQYSTIATPPSNYHSHLFQQLSTLDPYRNLYFTPYLAQNQAPFLCITNLNTNSCSYIPYRNLHYQFLDNNPNPILKIKEDTILKGTYHNTYTWYKNGIVIPQANNQVYYPTSSGIYKFSTQDAFNNTIFSNEINYIYTSTKESQVNDVSLNIYPNPCINTLTVNLYDNSKTEFGIYDITGKLLMKGIIANNSYKINTDNLQAGIYFIRIKNNLFKFIKSNQ